MRPNLTVAGLVLLMIGLLPLPPVAASPRYQAVSPASAASGEIRLDQALPEETLVDLAPPTPLATLVPVPTPTPRPNWGPPPRAVGVTVPILMYHYVRVNPDPRDQLGFGLSVTPANFAQQMDALAAAGIQPITVADLAGAVLGQNGLPARPVVLTFDDGYADFYTNAAPILRAHGFPAAVYVITGKAGSFGYLTWEQIEDLDHSGFTMAAHTVNHVPLDQQAPGALAHEIRHSKQSLEEHLHHPVVDFAYPYGKFNSAVEGEVRAAGFTTAASTIGGNQHSRGTLWHLYRVGVTGRDNLAAFLAKARAGR
jgi:peptidoglycan/xylan/chitin deacetylase (PgdA/CDA1 family)